MVFITDEIKDKIEDLDIEQVASELGLAVKNHKALCRTKYYNFILNTQNMYKNIQS